MAGVMGLAAGAATPVGRVGGVIRGSARGDCRASANSCVGGGIRPRRGVGAGAAGVRLAGASSSGRHAAFAMGASVLPRTRRVQRRAPVVKPRSPAAFALPDPQVLKDVLESLNPMLEGSVGDAFEGIRLIPAFTLETLSEAGAYTRPLFSST